MQNLTWCWPGSCKQDTTKQSRIDTITELQLIILVRTRTDTLEYCHNQYIKVIGKNKNWYLVVVKWMEFPSAIALCLLLNLLQRVVADQKAFTWILNQEHSWFIEIAFVYNIGMCACVSAFKCINNQWCDIDPMWLVKFYGFLFQFLSL